MFIKKDYKDKDKKFKKSKREKKVYKKKFCRFCQEKTKTVLDYKDVARLQKFMTERGKILPSRISGNCAKHQRMVARAIKLSRSIALLPYVAE